MADLQKVFVYVPSTSESAFETSVINVETEAAKYTNKIVFLEGTSRIWVKGNFYGGDVGLVDKKFNSVWKTINGSATIPADGNSALSETVGNVTYTDIVKWVKALKDETRSLFPEVKAEGSGISIKTDTTGGKTTYTVVADQSIWEFMGTATCANRDAIKTTLNAKYGTSGVRAEKEQGDVWSVTTTTPANTTLWAWDGNDWVEIGSASGVSTVDTTPKKGIALQLTSGTLSLSVTPGSNTAGNDSVITGGILNTAYTGACSYAGSEAKKAQDNSYAYTKAAKDVIYSDMSTYMKEVKIAADDAAYLTASYSGTSAQGGTVYTISLDESAVFNYVTTNLWETYGG